MLLHDTKSFIAFANTFLTSIDKVYQSFNNEKIIRALFNNHKKITLLNMIIVGLHKCCLRLLYRSYYSFYFIVFTFKCSFCPIPAERGFMLPHAYRLFNPFSL